MKQPNPDWEDEDHPFRNRISEDEAAALERHPLSEAWGDLSTEDMESMRKDIEASGLVNPRIILHEGMVLDGWHRLQACRAVGGTDLLATAQFSGESAAAFTISQNARRRHLTQSQAAMIAHRLSEGSNAGGDRMKSDADHSPDLANGLTQKEAAQKMGVGVSLVKTARKVANESPDLERKVNAGKIKLTAAAQELKRDERRKERERETKAALEAAQERQGEPASVHACSCREMIAKVEADSLDAVFTDPPYPKEFLPAWDELGEFAMHGLKPGGLLLALSGHLLLPEAMARLQAAGLHYRWTVAYVYAKPRGHIHAAKVSVGWKPCLAFRKPGGSPPDHYSEDAFMAVPKSGADKADHEWGQTEKDMQAIAREWLRPGWNVCDPFCGAGALLSAAKSIGCKVSGCDIEADHVAKTLAKLASCEIDTGGQVSHANEGIEALADTHIVRGLDSPADETGGLDEGYRQFAAMPKLDLIGMIRARDNRIDDLVREVRALMERKAA